MRKFFLILLFFSPQFHHLAFADFEMRLDTGWTFEQGYVFAKKYPGTVPGTIHTDLFANGLIPDPFYGTNETSVKWVEEKTWIYETEFDCNREFRKEQHIFLEFDGLDTYASVYLNDSLILTGEDMFMSYKIDVKRHLKTHNKLLIKFLPAAELIEKNKKASSIKEYPGGDRVFIRKAQYQFGWDWGPRFVTCGIWKPVRLTGWSDMHISDVVYKLDYLDKDTAFMTVDFTFESDKSGKYQFLVFQNDSGIYSDFYSVKKHKAEHLKITFKVAHPKLWWCNGFGEQHLYRFTLATFRRKKVCAVSTVTGIRKIEMMSDQMNGNGAFGFILNDKPVYIMGANWIPSDNFLPRVPDYKIKNQLTDMRDLHMNMVRVWGGGIYESDHFYAQCDSLGLLVWQDLPFACSMYPYATLDKNGMLLKEVTMNQRRIASHPSIAVWCGDNENKEGWFNWGWQKQFNYSTADSTSIYNDYVNYSLKFMGCVAQHDPFFPYIMSSPQNGWGREIAYERGDVHYWGVWWGMEPFSSYVDHTGRFVSEFGFQGAPSLHTFKEMGANVSKWFADSTIQLHQKHTTGYQTIETYMKRDYGITPNSFEDYVYLSQVLQKDAMSTAIESQRKAFPRCMGSMFWQYNDCWPVTSWSVQDYYGRKKLAWYELQRLYAPETVSIEETADSVFAWVSFNSGYPRAVHLHVDYLSFSGTNYFTKMFRIHPTKNASTIIWRESKAALKALAPLNQCVLSAYLVNPTGGGYQVDYLTTKLFGKPMERELPDHSVDFQLYSDYEGGPIRMTVKSKTFQDDVMIMCDDPNTTFSKNGVDLVPGRFIWVSVNTTLSKHELSESLRFTSMNRLVNSEKKELKTELPD